MFALLSSAVVAATVSGCSAEKTTATLPPTPTGMASSEITDTPVSSRPGEIFDFGGLKVRVTGVVDPFESSESSYVPLPQHRFVSVGFEVTNPSSSPKVFSPASESTLIDDTGQAYQMLLGQRSGDMTGEEIAPGATASGRVVFELPDSRRPAKLELHRSGIRGVEVKLVGA